MLYHAFSCPFSFSGKVLFAIMEMTPMTRMINRALNGNEEAKELLNVGNHKVIPTSRKITP